MEYTNSFRSNYVPQSYKASAYKEGQTVKIKSPNVSKEGINLNSIRYGEIVDVYPSGNSEGTREICLVRHIDGFDERTEIVSPRNMKKAGCLEAVVARGIGTLRRIAN